MPDLWRRDSLEGLDASVRDCQAYDSSLSIQALVDACASVARKQLAAVDSMNILMDCMLNPLQIE
jgi:hypothetical protein